MGDANTGDIYRDQLRKATDIGLSEEQARRLETLNVEERKKELQDLVAQRDANKPDLRTLEGALRYLNYQPPNEDTKPRHEGVNAAFQELAQKVWPLLPDGPGKTVALRALGRARMECNSTIATGGQ